MTSSNRRRRAGLRSASRLWQSPRSRALPRARRCREGKAGIPPPPEPVALTAWPRLREPSSTHRIFVPSISPVGPRKHRMPCSFEQRTRRMFYEGLDLSRLSGALKPSVVVTAADLARTGMRVPEFYAGDLMCPVGKTPLYLGQPVALLIFEDFDAFDRAQLALRDAAVLKFGAETGPVKMPNYEPVSFHAHWWPDSRRTRCLLDGQEWPGQPGILRQLGTPDLGTTCRRASLRRSRDLWGRDPRGARSQQSSALGAGPGIRDAVGRPHGSRAGKRPCLV